MNDNLGIQSFNIGVHRFNNIYITNHYYLVSGNQRKIFSFKKDSTFVILILAIDQFL